MDFIACTLKNFSISDYNGPLEIKSKDKVHFYLLYKEPDLLNIVSSFNYSARYGTEVVRIILENYVCLGLNRDSIADAEKRRVIVNNLYVTAQQFSNALWFIKDNAVTPYFTTISSDTNIEPEILRRNVYYSNSDTHYDSFPFNMSEIQEAMNWYELLEQFIVKMESKKVNTSKSLTNMSGYLAFNIPSFQRAYYFLDVARKTDFLPSKIATYISILETFYAVEGDNKHKTSERTAFLLGKDGEERIRIYDQISEAYVIRSKYVHGAYISDERNRKLVEVSKTLDSYVRMVFKEMLLNHSDLNYNSGKNQKVDKRFNELILNKV
jgi:hypothetical protein